MLSNNREDYYERTNVKRRILTQGGHINDDTGTTRTVDVDR